MIIESTPIENTVGVNWRLPYIMTILPTYKCTAACEQCCFQSNPSITHRVPQEQLLMYIDQARELETIKVVCFSGGEAFVLGNDLVELVERCNQHQFITRIVSNGYWATSPKAAKKRLMPLLEAGLNEINFSTGDDHAKFVPLERIMIGLQTSMDMGLNIALMIEDKVGREFTLDRVLEASKSYPRVHQALVDKQIKVLESPWMEFAENGQPVVQNPEKLVNHDNVHLRAPCSSVMTTIVVTPKEELGLCCGLPREDIPDLTGGSLKSSTIKEIVEETRFDFLKIWLFIEGPEKILAWASKIDPTIDWENKYAHNCDACRAMYSDPKVLSVIENHYHEKMKDIMFKYALYMEGQVQLS